MKFSPKVASIVIGEGRWETVKRETRHLDETCCNNSQFNHFNMVQIYVQIYFLNANVLLYAHISSSVTYFFLKFFAIKELVRTFMEGSGYRVVMYSNDEGSYLFALYKQVDINPQNGQTHSNNLSATADESFESE